VADDVLTRPLTRRQMLKGVGGLVAAGTAGSLVRVPNIWAAPRAAQATRLTSWIFRPEYRDAIEAMIQTFQKSHPDIQINMKYTPTQDYAPAVQTALVGGSMTDVYATSTASGIRGPTGADGGYVSALDGKVPLKDLLPTAANVVQYKGHTWAAPCQQFRVGFYINRPLFGKYKVKLPRTWDELRAVCQTFKDNGVTPIVMAGQDMIQPWFFYHLAVNSILGTKGVADLRHGKRKLTDADLLKAAQYTIDMQQYFGNGFQAVPYTEGKALFAQGRGAIAIGGSSDYAGYMQVNPNLEVGFIGFPPPKRTPHLQGITVAGLSMAMMVYKRSPNQAAATTWTTWWSSAEAQKAILQNIGLPSRKGIKPTGNDDRSRVLKSILAVPDTPSWLDYQETGNSLTKALSVGNGIFTGKMSARDFASQLQGDFQPS